MTRVSIDPNVRVRNNQTFVAMRHVAGLVSEGVGVEVCEEETGAVGYGWVTEIDSARGLVYLAVDWPSLRVADDGALVNERAIVPSPRRRATAVGARQEHTR